MDTIYNISANNILSTNKVNDLLTSSKNVNSNGNPIIEISWEICNKVGGIYTVIEGKLDAVKQSYGENYYLIGPLVEEDKLFVETDEEEWKIINHCLSHLDVKCKFGRWGKASIKTLLIDYKEYDSLNLMLSVLDYNQIIVNNYNWNGLEAAKFGSLSGLIVFTLCTHCHLFADKRVIAHFHEWMCGMGILFIKMHSQKLVTIFSTHATTIGRCASHIGIDYKNIDNFDLFAQTQNISTKYLIEKKSIEQSDYFVTISSTCKNEAEYIYKRPVDYITRNGRTIDDITIYSLNSQFELKKERRNELIKKMNGRLKMSLDLNSKLVLYAGRGEYKNKGLETVLGSIDYLNRNNHKYKHIIFLCVIAVKSNNIIAISPSETYYQNYKHEDITNETQIILERTVQYITNAISKYKLNQKSNVTTIFIPHFITKDDTLFKMDYLELLSLCDVSVFPSLYEPWGYTPHESILLGVPTITTVQSGFGSYIGCYYKNFKGIQLINLISNPFYNEDLSNAILSIISLEKEKYVKYSNDLQKIASSLKWNILYDDYKLLYNNAIK